MADKAMDSANGAMKEADGLVKGAKGMMDMGTGKMDQFKEKGDKEKDKALEKADKAKEMGMEEKKKHNCSLMAVPGDKRVAAGMNRMSVKVATTGLIGGPKKFCEMWKKMASPCEFSPSPRLNRV